MLFSVLARPFRASLSILVTVVLAAGLVLVASGAASAAPERRESKIRRALDVARDQKGDPYVYGADGPNSFDCSGLVQYSYGRAGIAVPRTSGDQARYFDRRAHKRNIRAGDLMAFYGSGGVYHVGLWTGRWQDGRRLILHASRSGTPVKVDRVWTRQWYAATLRTR
jgi:cell wall-associated NlpC family hydrolase